MLMGSLSNCRVYVFFSSFGYEMMCHLMLISFRRVIFKDIMKFRCLDIMIHVKIEESFMRMALIDWYY